MQRRHNDFEHCNFVQSVFHPMQKLHNGFQNIAILFREFFTQWKAATTAGTRGVKMLQFLRNKLTSITQTYTYAYFLFVVLYTSHMTSTCPVCYGEFPNGFAMIWHKKKCTSRNARKAADGVREVSAPLSANDNDDGGGSCDLSSWEHSGDEDGGLNVETGAIMKHLMNPEHRSLLRYWGWGASSLSAKDKEILDFLAVVDGAGGMSMAAASRVLKYVRARGNASLDLPKSMTTCWKHLDRVLPLPFLAPHKLHFTIAKLYVILQLQTLFEELRFHIALFFTFQNCNY